MPELPPVPVPIPAQRDVVYFGRANFRNENKLFGIKRKDRRQHTYVIGKTGTGKSVLIHNMIVQDISNGEGVCVIDPHGELVEDVLKEIPPHRLKDVVYFNPADTDFHIGFNVLELPDPRYKHLVASGLMSIFTKIWANVWSARMEYILNNAILALLETPGSTLLGITRILVDKEYRQKIVANVKDPVVRGFWVHEFEEWQDKFRNEAIAPIQNKVGQFLSTALIRNVVGQSKSTINIFDIMNEQKIFLVNVSKGRIGEDNSALLGAMIITKVQLSAMERVRIPENDRKDFYLYVDEFQNFATDSFASILSEARKYRLNLIVAHQYVGQLTSDTSTKVRDAVFGNVGTMIAFRVGATDAEFLEREFEPEFTPPDLIQLPNYHIYLKLMVDGVTSRPFSAGTLAPFHLRSEEDVVPKVIESSRRLYARSKESVEDEILRWSGMSISADGEASFARDRQVPSERRSDAPRGPQGSGPRRFTPRRSENSPTAAASHLAGLGIEFSGSGAPAPRQRQGAQGSERPRGGPPRNNAPRRPSPAPQKKSMSLNDLRGGAKGGKPEADRSALRSALEGVLGAFPAKGKQPETGNANNDSKKSEGGV